MKNMKMFLLYFMFLIGIVAGSHYRGGTMSYLIRSVPGNTTTNNKEISVQITQRHSWRRSAHFCNNTNSNSGNIIGENYLVNNQSISITSRKIPPINATVRCTDYSVEFDYSTGESSTTVLLPINKQIEFLYTSCCWIPLLSPDSESIWSLKFIINTRPRCDGNLNNSPRTAMNPVVQVQVGKIHVIQIPMADSDGDTVKCRWGKSIDECGSICTAKGALRSNPCELTYNATKLGYHAVAVVIEDFDSDNTILSAIPLQFLIHIVNITTQSNCTEPPIYIGEQSQGSCIGIKSNTTFNTTVKIRIPCEDTTITLKDILTVSPSGLIKRSIIRDLSDRNLYTMPIEWTPRSDQFGIHQLCLTPVDSQQRTGSQVCYTLQVDINPPEIVLMAPTGLVRNTETQWTIDMDRDIVKPKRSNGVYIRFFKRSNNQEVYRIDVTTDVNVIYQPRQITFFTTGHTWEQGEEYYILLDGGIAILNESCGVESALINNPYAWVFRVAMDETTVGKEISSTEQPAEITTKQSAEITTKQSAEITTKQSAEITTKQSAEITTKQSGEIATEQPAENTTKQSAEIITEQPAEITTKQSDKIATEQISSTRQTTSSSTRAICPQWFSFNRISNESTSPNEPYFTFCFTVETVFADVTIGANTWVPCLTWKLSGTADPLLELYTEPNGVLLAENDDGNALPLQNCYAAVISYRLPGGDYRVIIRNPKCAYGKFELRFTAEIDRNLK